MRRVSLSTVLLVTYLYQSASNLAGVTLHIFEFSYEIFNSPRVHSTLRHEIFLDILARFGQALHRYISNKTLNALLWNELVQRASKEKLLTGLRQHSATVERIEHLCKGLKRCRIDVIQGLGDAVLDGHGWK